MESKKVMECDVVVVGGGNAGLVAAIEAANLGGRVILLEKAPEDLKKRQDVYGPYRRAWKVTHKVKEALDPKNIFAPGRLPGRK